MDGNRVLSLQLCGPFEADGEPIEKRVAGRKNQAIVARLAYSVGEPVDREELSLLLWPDAGNAKQRASLRQALAVVRRSLPNGALVMVDSKPMLDPAMVHVDLKETLDAVSTFNREGMLKASGRYQGGLLPDFRSKSEVFDHWLEQSRMTVRVRVLDGLHDALALADQDTEFAIGLCQTLLSIDEQQPAVHQQLIRLLAETGDTVRAQQHITHFRTLFDRTDQSEHEGLAEEDGDEGTRRAVLPSIAVLPFTTVANEPDDRVIAEGMTEELISLLGQGRNWRVAARNTSFAYQHRNIDVRQVGTELGVSYVLEGAVRRAGNRLRLNVQLSGTHDGLLIWSGRYDRAFEEIYDLQDEMVLAILQAVKNRIGFAERARVRKARRESLDAWGLVLKAQQIIVVDVATRELQKDLIREALSIDPEFARAHSYFASVLFVSVGRGFSDDPKGDYALASKHAEFALASAPSDVVVIRNCAGGYAAVGQSEPARKLALQAYALTRTPDPLLVSVLMWSGEIDEAMRHCQAIVAGLNPDFSTAPGELRPRSLLGNLHMLRREFEDALPLAELDLAENPGNYFSHVNIANLYGYLDDGPRAQAAWTQAKGLVPTLTVASFQSGYESVCTDQSVAERFVAGLRQVGLM